MDKFPSVHNTAAAIGDFLRTISDAGYELRRVPQAGGVPEPPDRFAELVTDVQIQEVSGPLFRDHHYARSVEEAFKLLNNAVKEKSGIIQQDGAALMRSAFSVRSPVLRLNAFGSASDRDEQQGYMDIFAGSMTGIRNPRAHDHQLADNPDVALELLVLANHLMRKMDAATKNEPETA